MDSGILFFFAIYLLIFVVYIAFCMIPVGLAKKHGRSQFGWFFLSFLVSPLLGLIILACLGETEEKRKERVIEDAELRQLIESNYAHQESIPERKNNLSDKINDIYKFSDKTINDMFKK